MSRKHILIIYVTSDNFQ